MSVAERTHIGRADAFAHSVAPALPAILAVAALACIAGVLRAAVIIPLHVSLDPNEGWNAYHAAAAMAGHGLYPAAADFMVNNYPPLSFYVVGFLGTVVGDQIVAGRIVSLVSFVVVCAFAATIMRVLGSSRRAAAFSALLFAAILLVASDYVGMDDPQLLGQAFQLAGAFLVLRERRTRAGMLAAAALFVAGGFVKHNLFVLPLVSLVWLALYDPRNAKRLALWSAVLVFAGLVGFRAAYGFDLLARLDSARVWSPSELWSNFANWLPLAAVPFCGFIVLAARKLKEPRVAFVAIYAGIAVSAGVALLGGAGVDVNAMFDADMALALAAGLALDSLLIPTIPIPNLNLSRPANAGRPGDVDALVGIPGYSSSFSRRSRKANLGGPHSRAMTQRGTSKSTDTTGGKMWHRSLPRIFASLYAAACFLPLPIWSGAGSDWREPAFWIHPMQDDTAQAARDIAFLRGHPGPAMCESLAWCYWAGKPAAVDVYNLDQQLRSGARPLASFLPLIRAHRFAAIELDETIPFPLPKPVEAAILRNYRIDHADDEGTFFLRR